MDTRAKKFILTIETPYTLEAWELSGRELAGRDVETITAAEFLKWFTEEWAAGMVDVDALLESATFAAEEVAR